MASYKDFEELLRTRQNELQDLTDEEYLRFGNHIYVLGKEINITKLLDELARYGYKNGGSPVLFLHLYCHSLTGTLTGDELQLKVKEGGCALRSLHIFTVELPTFKKLVLVEPDSSSPPVRLYLYYDIKSSPESFYIRRSSSPRALVHVLRSDGPCMDNQGSACSTPQHFDTTAMGAVGVQLEAYGPLVPIRSICPDELRPARPAEFQIFGEHMSRLLNLPRLLDQLFISAGKQLMQPNPMIDKITAKLRFIILCGREAPTLVGLVTESHTLLSRLALPSGFPTSSSSDGAFFVPEKVPRTLESVMDIPINTLLNINGKLESGEQIQNLRALIQVKDGDFLKTFSRYVGTTIERARLNDEASQAAYAAEAARDQIVALKGRESDLKMRKSAFDEGVKEYERSKQSSMVWDLFKSVCQVFFDVGVAIYSGGSNTALTVKHLNEALSGGATAVKKGSDIWRILKALAMSLHKVYPTIQAAIKDHNNAMEINHGANSSERFVDKLKAAADSTSGKVMAIQVGERIDYLDLLADWREMDVSADAAFDEIQKEIDKDTIKGMSEYRQAIKQLAVRGEIVVTALKEAYETRTRYLVRAAETKAKEEAVAEVTDLHYRVVEKQASEKTAFMSVKQRLLMDITQRRRVVFNMLHQGVLALVYESSDARAYRRLFEGLSPGLTAIQLNDQWDIFKRATISGRQPQEKTLVVGANDALPLGWRELLVHDLKTTFEIKTDLKALKYNYHMRIREIGVEFVGLAFKGSSDSVERFPYIITLGPSMMDRASPYAKAPSSKAEIVQYYMEPIELEKCGDDNRLLDDKGDFAKRAVCCSGMLSFRKEDVSEGWELGAITDIKITIKYETFLFSR